MAEHRCAHGRADHRHNGAGRCNRPGCACLVGPGRLNKPVVAERTPAGGVVTVDGNTGMVLDYQPAAHHSQSERTRLERMLWRRIEEAGLPLPVKQFYWARPERMFRSDFAYVAERLLLEVDGGIWMRGGGGHSHPMHLEAQHYRDNLAVLLGYRLLRFTEKMVRDGTAIGHIKRALQPASHEQTVAL